MPTQNYNLPKEVAGLEPLRQAATTFAEIVDNVIAGLEDRVIELENAPPPESEGESEGDEPGYDIILLGGQSNMVGVLQSLGVGNPYEPDPELDPTDTRIFQWSIDGTGDAEKAGVLLEAIDPLLFPEDLISAERTAEYAVGPGMAFARYLLTGLPANRSIVLIPAAVRGTGMSGTHNWSVSGDLYLAMKQAALDALAELPNSRVTHFLWVQGEEDAENGGTDIANYESRVTAMLTDLRDALDEPALPFITGGISPEYRTGKAGYVAIDEIHKAFPMSVPHCFHIPMPTGYAVSGNEIHTNATGQRQRGVNMGIVASSDLTALLTNEAPGEITEVAVVNDSTASIKTPGTSQHAFRVQTRPQGSEDSWTAADYFFPDEFAGPNTTIEIPVPGTGLREFRVIAVSYGGGGGYTEPVNIGTPAPNPTFSNVTLLCNFAGTDAATTADDESSTNATLTFNGNAQIDTAISKFGDGALMLDGTGDWVSAPDNTAYEFGSGSFCVEAWVRWDTAPTNSTAGQGILGKWITTSNQRGWNLSWGQNSENELKFFVSTDGTAVVERLAAAWAPAADTWYHVAVSKSGNVYRMFIDGVQVATATQTETLFGGTAGLTIGNYNTANYLGATGGPAWIGGARITKGEAVYTAAFNPPIEPFPNS